MHQEDIDDLLGSRNRYVRNAAAKLVEGSRLTGNESRRLGRLMTPERRDHFAAIASTPLRVTGRSDGPANPLRRRGPAIEDIDNLEPKLRGRGTATTTGAAFTQAEWNVMLAVATDITSTVAVNGQLVNTLIPAGSTTSGYPALLKMVNSTKSIELSSTGLTVVDSVTGDTVVLNYATGIVMTKSSTGKVLSIAFADITQNMSIKTIQVCDSGTIKSMRIIASDPF